MSNTQLAIATIPMQEWGPLYEESEALRNGTIFKDLDMPFFAAVDVPHRDCDTPKSEEQKEREALLMRIMKTSFVLDDLILYLDTHAEDVDALALFREKGAERAELKKEYAQKFYALTRDCLVDVPDAHVFAWEKGPMPWEGGCI